MTIKIVLPQGDGVRSCHGTKVYTHEGAEIDNVLGISINLAPNELITATLTIAVSDVVGLDGVLPHLSEETLKSLNALGYKVERFGVER